MTVEIEKEAEQLAAKIMEFNLGFFQWNRENFGSNFNINGKSEYDLTIRKFHILGIISHIGLSTISQLENFMGISKSSLSLTITKLEKEGYLTKQYLRGKGDGRKVYIHVTQKGEEALKEANRRWVKSFCSFYNSLSLEKQGDLKAGLKRLSNIFTVKEEEKNEK